MSYDPSMKLSLTGTDSWSRALLASPDGRTLSGLWWAITAASMWLFSVVLTSSGDLVGLLGVPPALWSSSRAIAQALRGKFYS